MAKKKSAKRRPPKRRAPKSYSVFVSHATDDKWIARVICEKLESAGAETFRDDRDIKGGDSIPVTIKTRIRQADEVAVLLTPQSVSRQWVLIEIGMAAMVDRKVVPLLYHIDVNEIPAIIKDNRAYWLNEFDQYLLDVQERVTTK